MFPVFKLSNMSYLKTIDHFTKDIDPQLLRQLIRNEFNYGESDGFTLRPKKNKHKITQKFVESTLLADPNTDITKGFTAFGRLAIPKLKKQLLHQDLLVSRQAIVTLLDFVHDPEKTVECIRLNVLARLVRLMVSEDNYTRQHTLCVLKVIASQPGGPAAIAQKIYIIKNLKTVLLDVDSMVKLQAAMTCMYLCRSWQSFSCMVEAGFVDRFLAAICTEKLNGVKVVLLNALENILDKSDLAKKEAVSSNVCHLLAENIKHKCPMIRAASIAVLVQVFISCQGKIAGEICHVDLIQWLIDSLDDNDETVIQQASTALAFLFVRTPCKLRGELPALNKLLPLALCSKNLGIAANSIQAIINLASHPLVKSELRENYLPAIQLIDTQNDPQLMEIKKRLIEVIKHNV